MSNLIFIILFQFFDRMVLFTTKIKYNWKWRNVIFYSTKYSIIMNNFKLPSPTPLSSKNPIHPWDNIISFWSGLW